MKPELHRQVVLASLEKGISLNQLVAEAVSNYVGQ
jgi:predicted HicB family RNase H-like nuclease